jgi:hypothetical protein
MRQNIRNDDTLQKIVDERPFVIPTAPGAAALRGDYQAGSGLHHFTWSASFKGNFTTVFVTLPSNATNAKIEDYDSEVMAKVFGSDRYVPDVSAAQ